jgi:hypothetical protein
MRALRIVTNLGIGAAMLVALALPAAEERQAVAHARASGDQQQCSLTAKIFLELGQQRNRGATPEQAVAAVNRSLSSDVLTGSHLQQDFQPAVASAVGLVYKRRDLNERTLGSLGYRSCRLHQHFADDPQRRDAAIGRLLGAAADCQHKFPRKNDANQLARCMRDRSGEIAAQLGAEQAPPEMAGSRRPR